VERYSDSRKDIEPLHIGAMAAAIDGDGILWMSDSNYNGLYQYELEKNEMSLAWRFEDVELYKDELHRHMKIAGDEIYLLPLKDNKIRIYNKRIRKEHSIEIPKERDEKIYTWLTEDKCWLFFENYTQDIMCFDFKTKTLFSDVRLNELCLSLTGRKDRRIWKGSNEQKLNIYNEENKQIYSINVNSYQYEVIDVSEIQETIDQVFYIDKCYWITLSNSQDVYLYERGVFTKYNVQEEAYIDDNIGNSYSNVISWEDEVLLLNGWAKDIRKISKTTKTIEKAFREEKIDFSGNRNYGACFLTALRWKDSLLIIPLRSKHILQCDKNIDVINKFDSVSFLNERDVDEMILAMIRNEMAVSETSEISTLRRYINKINSVRGSRLESFFGATIYFKVKEI